MTDETMYTATITPSAKSRIEITGEIPWTHLSSFEDAASDKLTKHVELPGFRKGNVPKDIARKQIPDDVLLADMAELAIGSVYPLILREHTLDVIGRPKVTITKIARGNPLGFTITIAVVPTIALPDYKKIASTIALEEAKEVTDADVDKVVDDLRQMRAYGHVHPPAPDHAGGRAGGQDDNHTHTETLPEATDEFAQSFGNFKTLAELRAKIKENLMLEADHAANDKRRVTIMEDILKETTFDVPEVVLNAEKEKMFVQLEADVARSGASMADYLAHIGKTREILMEEFTPEADKRARFQLLLNAVARAANIAPTDEAVEAETQKYIAMYPGADHSRTRAYADMMLTNEMTLAHIEGK